MSPSHAPRRPRDVARRRRVGPCLPRPPIAASQTLRAAHFHALRRALTAGRSPVPPHRAQPPAPGVPSHAASSRATCH